jgi:hypothetical protein
LRQVILGKYGKPQNIWLGNLKPHFTLPIRESMTYGAQKKLVKALGAEQTPVNLIKLAQDEVWLGT